MAMMVMVACASVEVTTFESSNYITTIAGIGARGYNGDGILATDANLSDPNGLFVNSLGEVLIADTSNNRVRKIQLNGKISTIAGTGVIGDNGVGMMATDAYITSPCGVAENSLGEVIIADTGRTRVLKILLNGRITKIAGYYDVGYNGDEILATDAALSYPNGVAVNSLGEVLIADTYNHRVRKILLNGTITTIAGTGNAGYNGDEMLATDANLNYPYSVALNSLGEVVIADYSNHRVRKVLLNGTITTIAGNGNAGYNGDDILATYASLNNPYGVAVNSLGEVLIGDYANQRVRKIQLNGKISTIAGTGVMGYNGDGILATSANMYFPCGVAVNSIDEVLIADANNHRIRKLSGCPPNSIQSGQQCNCVTGYFGYGQYCDKYNCSNIVNDRSDVCSSNGKCVSPNNCTCNAGYYGSDCELYKCNDILFNDTRACSSLGSCIAPNICTCNTGYFGADCELYNCSNILFNDTSACSSFGSCIAPNNCTCNTGYYGNNCDLFDCYGKPKTNTSSVCSGSGQCTGPNNCICNAGYFGADCELYNCNNILFNDTSVCSSFGSCIAPNNCTCNTGYYGNNCDLFDCYGKPKTNTSSVCSGSGQCTGPNNCTCNTGYYGNNCEQFDCYGIPKTNVTGVCSGSGQCTGPNKCFCNSGWNGTICEIPLCDGIQSSDSRVCNGHGSCDSKDLCKCSQGWGSTFCNVPICNGTLATQTNTVCGGGHGFCSAPDVCNCTNNNYGGQFCTIPICNGTLANSGGVVCNGHGLCNSDAKCECTDVNWGGPFCEIPKCNGILANNQSSVCNGHGTCTNSNQCVCSSGYGPSGECKYPICFGTLANDTTVGCSGRGICSDVNQCTCTDVNYGGADCSIHKCNGILASNSSVCSNGNGICSTVDTCVCQNGFVGKQCSLYYISIETLTVSFNSTQDYILESSTTVRIVINNAQFAAFYNTRSVTVRYTHTLLDSGSTVVVSVVFTGSSSSSTLEAAVPSFKAVGKVSVSVQLIDTESGIVISDNVQSTNTLTIVNRSRVVSSASQLSYLIGILLCLAISLIGLF